MTISTFGDLIQHFDAAHDTPASLSRRLYKDTGCGAWLSFETTDGLKSEEHEEKEFPLDMPLASITIGTIVEGSEATFDQSFDCPVDSANLDAWIQEMEGLAAEAFEEANEGEDEEEEGDDTR